ncbi:AfsR/SARP family transcriptional regulator [Actinacidiphila acididurans]|uniref:Response regulator n=1 Tax=Actinacidiphila acididurans TaxID=2784346 RepID=A0ABS2TPL4_9ACTN|nr:hypothetical protein [Actinacidiphila acididurans]MBM9504446.1 hypothetical protein [Actinacidiphila acididurans]
MSVQDDKLRIDLLGPLRLRRNEQELRVPPRSPARLLVHLALIDRPAGTRELCKLLGITRDNLNKLVERLRQHDVPMAPTTHDGLYALDRDRAEVDVWQFVGALAPSAPLLAPDALERLLSLWRGDPKATYYEDVAEVHWSRVDEARARMLDLIGQLPVEGRPAGLARFVGYFPLDRRAADLLPVRQRPGYKRLLVVDDTHAEAIRDILSGDYDVTTVDSVDGWLSLRDGGELEHFDGAVVDLYLTDNLGGYGHRIVDHLRDRTDIPCALISRDPPAAAGDPSGRYFAQHRVLYALSKGSNDRNLVDALPEIADRLVGESPVAETARLRCWLNWACEMFVGPVLLSEGSKSSRVTAVYQAKRKAEQALDEGRLPEARTLVDSFCRKYVGRGGPRGSRPAGKAAQPRRSR